MSRVVHHFQFTTWPENGAPKEGAGMIDLIGQVLRVQQQTGNKPIIVHCRYRNQNRYVITKPLQTCLVALLNAMSDPCSTIFHATYRQMFYISPRYQCMGNNAVGD